jgi:MFS family permease
MHDRQLLRPWLGGWLGFFVVSYDGALSSIALAPAFLYFLPPDTSGLAATAFILTAFNASRIGRPIGAIWFGSMVDRGHWRRAALLSAAGYGALTVAAGLLPGQADWGLLAPAALLGLRAVTGVFVAGQVVAIGPSVIRNAPSHRRWLIGSTMPTGAPAAYVAGSLLTLIVLDLMPAGDAASPYAQWGWRIPFWFAAAVSGVLLMYVLRFPPEPRARESLSGRRPARDLFGGANISLLWRLFVLFAGIQLILSTSVVSLPAVLIQMKHYESAPVMAATMAAYACLLGGYLAAGYGTRLIGATRMFMLWAVASTVVGGGLLLVLTRLEPGVHLVLSMAIMIAVTTIALSVAGFMHTYAIEAFDESILATGYGTARTLAEFVPVLSGLYLVGIGALFGPDLAPFVLIVLGGVLTIVGARMAASQSPAPAPAAIAQNIAD